MPSDGPTLRDRFAADLRSGSLPVLVTAVALALIFLLATGMIDVETEAAFLVVFLIGVGLPLVHEDYWPQDRPWHRDVAWTVVASALTAGIFVGSYALAGEFVAQSVYAAIGAFVMTVVAGGVLLAVIRP